VSDPLRAAALLIAAVVVGVVAGLALLEGNDGPTSAERTRSAPLTARTAIRPRVHVFGDPLVAEVDVILDRRRVDAETVRIDPIFTPFEQVATATRERSRAGDSVRLVYRYALGCFNPACVPTGERRSFELPSVRVAYSGPSTRGRTIDSTTWPAFDVASRLGPSDVEQPRWRADQRRLEPAAYRLSPGVLGAGLIGSAALLVAGAALLAGRLLPRRGATAVAPPDTARASPLEGAAELVRLHALGGRTPDGRRALEGLARELGAAGRSPLARRARALAWSPAPSDPAAVERLLTDVRDGNDQEAR